LLAHIFAEAFLPFAAFCLAWWLARVLKLVDGFLLLTPYRFDFLHRSHPCGQEHSANWPRAVLYLKKGLWNWRATARLWLFGKMQMSSTGCKSSDFWQFLHQGQICMAINRIIGPNGCNERFVEGFVGPCREAEKKNG